MNTSENDIELIEKYFDQELDDQQKVHFNERLQSDTRFKELYEQEKILIEGIRYRALQSNLQHLKKIEVALEKGSGTSFFHTYRWTLAIAASITLFIVAYVTFFNSPKTPEELFQAYFTPYPNVFEPTVRSSDAINTRKEAFQAYEAGDYKRAAVLFEELVETESDPGTLLLLGNANLMLNNIEKAKNNFITLSKDYDELDMQAKWYLSLCYLKNNETEEAKKILEELGETDITYAIKARELLKEVN